MKSESLSLEIIINKLDFLEKTVLFTEIHEKKDLQFFATKLTEKISDPHDVKEELQSFIRKKNTKSVKQSNIITQQPKLWKTHTLFHESTKLISIFRKNYTFQFKTGHVSYINKFTSSTVNKLNLLHHKQNLKTYCFINNLKFSSKNGLKSF